MGKRKTSAYYQQKATQAKARETYYASRPARPQAGGTVKEKNTATFIYRSVFKFWTTVPGDTDSNDHFPYKVEVDNDALQKVPAASVGLVTVGSYTGNSSLAESVKRRLSPSRASWYSGTGTPVPVTTAWNSSWIRYYDAATGDTQTHFSLPISKATGSFTAADVFTAFKSIFYPAGVASTALLGAKNGAAELKLEYTTAANRISS